MIREAVDRLRYAPAAFWRCLMVCGVVLAALCAVAAHARDVNGIYAESEHHEWYGRQHNDKGEWCCDKSDGHPYYGSVTINPDGSIILDGGHKIPAYMVLKGANPTGHAVWWFLETTSAGHVDYCFAPGSLT